MDSVTVRYQYGNLLRFSVSWCSRNKVTLERLKKYDKESYNYYALLTELETLSTFLEQERFTFKAIRGFHKKKEVQDSISRLNAALQMVLGEEKKDTANNGIHRTGDPRGGSPAGDS